MTRQQRRAEGSFVKGADQRTPRGMLAEGCLQPIRTPANEEVSLINRVSRISKRSKGAGRIALRYISRRNSDHRPVSPTAW